MNTEAMVHQLLSVRSAIDAMLSTLTAPSTACTHPQDRRQVLGTLGTSGAISWMCRDCGHTEEVK